MTLSATHPARPSAPAGLAHFAAAVSPYPEARDGVVLGSALTRAAGGDLMLIAIEPDLPLVVPGADWRQMRRETRSLLERTQSELAPEARAVIDSDLSIARGLRRVIDHEHRQVLVTGSSRHGAPGVVTIGKHVHQLVHHMPCALALAPRGLSEHPDLALRRIGVGFDGGPEAREALRTAAELAARCGAQLIVRGVVDDRVPALGWPHLWSAPIAEAWNAVMNDEVKALEDRLERAAAELPVTAVRQAERGLPAESLEDLSADVDLLVIGSRRWGTVARLLLGGTGEALAHGARCALLVVPRPQTES